MKLAWRSFSQESSPQLVLSFCLHDLHYQCLSISQPHFLSTLWGRRMVAVPFQQIHLCRISLSVLTVVFRSITLSFCMSSLHFLQHVFSYCLLFPTNALHSTWKAKLSQPALLLFIINLTSWLQGTFCCAWDHCHTVLFKSRMICWHGN